jgi:hypothetical protein
MCRAAMTALPSPSRLPKRILVWHETQRVPARCYIEANATSLEEIETVPVVVIESNDWLNHNVRAGDLIFHHA